MSSLVSINDKRYVDFEDVFGEVSVPADGTRTVVATRRLKTGKRPFLIALGMAWAADMDTFVAWHLEQEGSRLHPFDNSEVQIGTPESPFVLPARKELTQGALIELTMDSSVLGNGSARFIIGYEDY